LLKCPDVPSLDFQNLVATFIVAAVSERNRAEDILIQHPSIAEAGFHVALVLGNVKDVERALTAAPALAKSRGGPRNWEPLLYVCFSRYSGASVIETARVLLLHGADPNAAWIPEDMPDNPLSCLYAAIGLNNNPALAQTLLEAGANPNDSESLYHSTEHRDLVCMKLLLRHGATSHGTNALKHMLDREDIAGLKLLLEAGANPNEVNPRGETALHWAIWRGRSVAAITALLDSGAALEAKRHDGRTAYAMAAERGQQEVVSLLEARGAIPVSADTKASIPDLAMSRSTVVIRALLAAGEPVDERGDMGATALHWACWKGYADLVKLLLDHGASLTIEDQQFHGTPPGWFAHGLHSCDERVGDYPQVARLLIAAGATIPSVDLPTGDAGVDAVLWEHGLL
jgi:ankyrin repeat protein